MALRKILTKGDEQLAKHCRPVEKFDDRLHVLIDDMRETLENSGGVGLAAPQIGILRRVVVLLDVNKDPEEMVELVNPEVIEQRGAAPIQWAVIAGDEKAGVTTMLMAEGLDTGDMLLTSETPVGARETAGELFDRLAQSGAELLTETLVRLDEITPRPQNDAESCYAHMLDKKMAVIDWSKSARELDCLVRGLNPWPIALTSLAGERLKIYAAEPADGCGEPGTVLEADPKKGLTVACGEGALTLTEIQLVGGKRMKATDFLRGHVVEKGSRLGE